MATKLSDARIRTLIERSREPKSPSFDELLKAELFGPKEKWPVYDSDWPASARLSYMRAVDLYIEQYRQSNPSRRVHREFAPPEIRQVWDAVLAYAPDPARWWVVPNLTWRHLGNMLGIGARAATYYCRDVQGWRFNRGGGGAQNQREIVAAPCVRCGAVVARQLIEASLCPDCQPIDRTPGPGRA